MCSPSPTALHPLPSKLLSTLLAVVVATGLAASDPASAQPTFSGGVLPSGVPDGASGNNVLTEDPLFYDPASGDYRPDKPAGSPLVDLAGSEAPMGGRLLNGQTQTENGWDAGALESNGSALPVEWAGLSAHWDGGAAHLSWQTASETKNGGFRVERRVDAPAEDPDRRWQAVGFVEGAGTTTRVQSYRFVDEEVPFTAERLWYRLVQVDVDGTTAASDSVVVKRPSPDRVRLDPPAPNPASTAATVRFALPDDALSGGRDSGGPEARLVVFDMLGRQVEAHSIGARGEKRGAVRLPVVDWPAGPYFVRLRVGSETRTERLTVVR